MNSQFRAIFSYRSFFKLKIAHLPKNQLYLSEQKGAMTNLRYFCIFMQSYNIITQDTVANKTS